MKTKLKYLGVYLLIAIGGSVFASLFSEWFTTTLSRSTEHVIGIALFACIAIGVCIAFCRLRKGEITPDGRRYIIAIVQWAILMASFYGVNGWTVVLLGLAVVYLQMIFPLRFAGWVSAVAYPVTYCISNICDTPAEGNLYVYWAFSYFAVVALAILADILLMSRKTPAKR